jgi:hypothetical protein
MKRIGFAGYCCASAAPLTLAAIAVHASALANRQAAELRLKLIAPLVILLPRPRYVPRLRSFVGKALSPLLAVEASYQMQHAPVFSLF